MSKEAKQPKEGHLSILNYPSRVILHCSATPDSGNVFGAEQLRRWHIVERGWVDIGYHYVIKRDGMIQIGRGEHIRGAHCSAGGGNNNSLGVCYIGTKYPTASQLTSLTKLFFDFRKRLKINSTSWFGHYEFDENKTCPGIPMVLFRAWLAQSELLVLNGLITEDQC